MKKRLLCLFLAGLLALGLGSGVQAAAGADALSFLAVNDSLPYTLDTATMPMYSGGVFYIPYDIFNVTALGVYTSYNPANMTLVLFNKSRKLLFYISDGIVVNQDDEETDLSVIVKGSMVFVPAAYCISYFGFSLSTLQSLGGYTVYRITTGSQVLANPTFINQADTLIEERAADYLAAIAPPAQTGTTVPVVTVDPAQSQDPSEESSAQPGEEQSLAQPQSPTYTMYLMFLGVTQTALDWLDSHDVQAAFFLTQEEILDNAALVRSLVCGGHTVGIRGQTDEALADANAALRLTAGRQTLLALTDENPAGYLVCSANYTADQLAAQAPTDTHTPLLTAIDGTDALLTRYLDLFADKCQLLQLTETTIETGG